MDIFTSQIDELFIDSSLLINFELNY